MGVLILANAIITIVSILHRYDQCMQAFAEIFLRPYRHFNMSVIRQKIAFK